VKRYTVTWLEVAQDRLMVFWMGSRFASQITAAADWFDINLSTRPYEVGESRSGALRIALQSPLAINFFIDEENRQVIVLDVWTI
jgi:hypothetical protein